MYNPPRIALEYYLKSFQSNYLLEINLDEYIHRIESPEKISGILFKQYSDIMNENTVDKSQLASLIEKVILHKKSEKRKSKQIC